LAVGSNTAIFAVVHKILIEPLPYPNADRLVHIREMNPQRAGARQVPVRPVTYETWKDNHSFEEIGLSTSKSLGLDLTGYGEPELIPYYIFSRSMFHVLGVEPMLGRIFSEAEDKPGAPPVVVLSHKLWQRRFNSDPNILGKSLTLSGTAYTVIGVMPRTFNQPGFSELWVPLQYDPADPVARERFTLRLLGRLKPGVTAKQASDELTEISKRNAQQLPATHTGWTVKVQDMKEEQVGDIKPALLILMSAVGLLLLIALANIANLMLWRMHARSREIAIRVALGATRTDLLRQTLAESAIFAILGGTAGVLLAYWGLRALLKLPQTFVSAQDATLDMRVLLFAFAVSVVTG
jgi:predicted permease